ncbi:MAG: bifunctional demethylmenaquinone methyltransferase/2-methoxy-6-polyprenyl-1,4-benzoquinol methylase UbiE [Verrucomicrobia bacterium]|nr:bifunctional demethylmenaquinone methyltransferase/2-methoxy-6-polyprenyl-1,4-benzoquinol methylase UbiE [Verrucomicrobiota bacterium]
MQDSWKMFNSISPTYDVTNRILSLGIDKWWRKKVASFLPKQEKITLLDVATGTGDQLLALMDRSKNITQAIGVDPAYQMLQIAEEKARRKPYRFRLEWREASASHLPFAPHSFDVATISFGIRNIPEPVLAMQEIRRVLKNQGKLLVLEFSKPTHPWLQAAHLWYLRKILPKVGGFISKNPAAYEYLNTTIEAFPSGPAFCILMKEAGFQEVSAHPLTGGIVTLYQGIK